MSQDAIPKEERVKQAAVFVCLILSLAVTSASAQAIRNPGFDSNLNNWWLCCGLSNNATPGTVAWEGPGSVLLVDSGAPGSTGLAQPTCDTLYVGDSAWVDVNVLHAENTTIGLSLGDEGTYGQYVQIEAPSPGFHRLVIHADRKYKPGTWYGFSAMSWPGSCTLRISYANASLLEGEKQGTTSVVRSAMEANPNPATGRTNLSFNIPRMCKGRLVVYDATGNLVRNIERRLYSSGLHSAVWNGRDESGQLASPGTYLIRLTTDDGHEQTTSVVVTR
jgi:hypothetical protein